MNEVREISVVNTRKRQFNAIAGENVATRGKRNVRQRVVKARTILSISTIYKKNAKKRTIRARASRISTKLDQIIKRLEEVQLSEKKLDRSEFHPDCFPTTTMTNDASSADKESTAIAKETETIGNGDNLFKENGMNVEVKPQDKRENAEDSADRVLQHATLPEVHYVSDQDNNFLYGMFDSASRLTDDSSDDDSDSSTDSNKVEVRRSYNEYQTSESGEDSQNIRPRRQPVLYTVREFLERFQDDNSSVDEDSYGSETDSDDNYYRDSERPQMDNSFL